MVPNGKYVNIINISYIMGVQNIYIGGWEQVKYISVPYSHLMEVIQTFVMEKTTQCAFEREAAISNLKEELRRELKQKTTETESSVIASGNESRRKIRDLEEALDGVRRAGERLERVFEEREQQMESRILAITSQMKRIEKEKKIEEVRLRKALGGMHEALKAFR